MLSFAPHGKRLTALLLFVCLVLLASMPMLALAQDTMEEDSLFISIRLYGGLESDENFELFRHTAEEFMGIIRETDGYIGYYWLFSGESVAAISLFDSEAQATASNEAAADYVAANLADLVPEPPTIIEGQVDIGFVELLDGMSDEEVANLHASVRLYEDFAAENLNAFVTIVEDGFLPLMRETDGFFGYYLMNNGAGTLGAISIFDSEASALASNERARDVVAEYLTAFLPSSPTIVSGPVHIASLKSVKDGANMIVDDMAKEVYASIRVYDGIAPVDYAEIERAAREGLVPIISASDGFIAYYVVYPDDGTLAAVNLFETREQALASNELARDFVVEYLAPLLPNPPRIVEGAVDIGVVEMLDGMGDGGINLHGSVRIYDEFSTDSLSDFVALVEDGFLPIMRETDGFFGYYLMNDGAGTLGAISIFDSEASASASNEEAADFVAENLTAFLPNAPQISSGRVGIAVLDGVNDGENLIAAEQRFVSIRVYDGINPADQDEILRLVDPGFLTIMRASDGFVGYYLLPAGDTLAAVTVFDSAEQASASNAAARDYVAEYMAPLLPNPPTIYEGPLGLHVRAATEDLDAEAMEQGFDPFYASVRIYADFDLAHFDDANALAWRYLVPKFLEIDGFFAQYTIHDNDSHVVAVSIYRSEEAAAAANQEAVAFSREHLTQWSPEPPSGFNATVGVASLAEMRMGKNLIANDPDDEVYASIRVYDGIDPADQDEIVRLTAEILPIIRENDGFVGYYLLPAGDMLAGISLFETAEQASASNEAAREFVAENLAPLLPNPPLIVEGALDVTYVVDEMMGDGSLYAALRIYDNYDLSDREQAVVLVETGFLPIQQEADGLFSYFSMDDGVDRVVALSVYDTEENALAANALAADFVAENMSQWIREDPTRINGRLGVTAFADIQMGENLISGE